MGEVYINSVSHCSFINTFGCIFIFLILEFCWPKTNLHYNWTFRQSAMLLDTEIYAVDVQINSLMYYFEIVNAVCM